MGTTCDTDNVTCREESLNTKRETYNYQNNMRNQGKYINSNKKKNEWFGDEMIFHDNWATGEYTETMRIGSININGIAKQLDWLEWDSTIQTMYNLQIDTLGVTEPNVNFNNKRTLLQIRDIAKKTDKNIQLATSCSNQLNSTGKKMGGTMTILAGRWAGRKIGTTSDSKGRWSSITLTGKKIGR